jgi:hypothetical protein
VPDYARILSSTRKQQPETPRATDFYQMQAVTRHAAVTNLCLDRRTVDYATLFGVSLEAFLAKMRQLPQDRSVQSAIGIVEDYLKQAEEYERRKVLKAEGTKPDATG